MITGHFLKYIFRSDSSGYTVAVFAIEQGREKERITVTGYLPVLDFEYSYKLEGEYVDHPRYGVQYRIDSFEQIEFPMDTNLVNFFSSDRFKGIGKITAQRIVETLGENAIELIRSNPDILASVPKLKMAHRQSIVEGLGQKKEDQYQFLTSHQLTMKVILQLEHFYGEELMSVLYGNPYQMMYDISGIGFITADKFARSIGIAENDIRRLQAYSESILMQQCMKNGDSYLLYEEFHKVLEKELIALECNIDEIIQGMEDNNRIVREENRIYTLSQYEAENYIAQYLNYFPFEPFEKIKKADIDKQLTDIEDEFGIVYQEKQIEAIEAFFENDVLVLTGGPGTGKTTIVHGMVELCKRLFPEYVITLCAPTGRAAKRLAELTGCKAKTIHSLLNFNMETGTFGKNEEDPVFVDLLIIDEFSMVDQWVFYNLLKAGSQFKKIIIIGDQDQLPSVGMGAVLRDIIDSQLFKVVKLEKIYRQKDGSDIISLANDVRLGQCNEIRTDHDIRFFECENGDVRRLTLQVVEHALNNYPTQREGFMNVQVLSPKYSGTNGIESMNVALQAKFNPPAPDKKELKVGYRTYRIGDKILQCKNQPDFDVYNGDIGIIIDIIPANEDIAHQNRIVADFEGIIAEYTSDTFANITHAYCVSVHKAQGSEYPIVIMPMANEYGIMLQKRLIYTGITRANRSLVMIGDKQAFFKGINRKEYYHRKTTLKERLWTLFDQQGELLS